MRILVLHQVPFRKIGYDALLDHDAHEVIYLGTEASLAQIPPRLRHAALPVADPDSAGDEHVFAQEVAAVLSRRGPAAVDAVVSLSEFGHYAGAVARRHFGLPAHADEQIARVRDKVAMKRAVHAAGLAIPRFSDGEDPAAPSWTGPTIVKPRDGAGSTGVRSFASVAEAQAARGAEDELEEYVDAPVLHVDGFVHGGVLHDATVAECLGSPLEYAQGRVIASVQVDEPAAVAFTEAALAALGVSVGAVHVEVFRRGPGDYVFLEAGQRVGGAGVLTAHRRRTGVDLAARELRAQAGLPYGDTQPPSGRHHGFLLGATPLTPEARRYVADVLAPDTDALFTNDADSVRAETYQEWEVPVFAELSADGATDLRTVAGRHVAALNRILDARVPQEI